ncbi:hypothetical protein L218DRAFT_1077875 [Marasmius fiardii PR-910]|nr:hypothetical protein L218DRAFT_1077875 [Marasmius fiardii PR-910]
MYRSFTRDALFPTAGRRQGLRPALPLTITIPAQDRVEVDLVSSGADHLRYSNARSARRAHFVSQFHDTDTEETDDEWDNHAQYLSISPLYQHPPARPTSPSFDSDEAHLLSFSCDAVDDDIDAVAQRFHDELGRLAYGLGELDLDCLKELGSELVNSPIRLFQDTFFQTMRRRVNSALPPVMAPENIPTSEESDNSDDDNGELYFGDSEDDEDEQDTEEGIAPFLRPNELYGLDLGSVAPFNEYEKDEDNTPKSNSLFKFFRRKRH